MGSLSRRLRLNTTPLGTLDCDKHGKLPWRGTIVCASCSRIYFAGKPAQRAPGEVQAPKHCGCRAPLLPPAQGYTGRPVCQLCVDARRETEGLVALVRTLAPGDVTSLADQIAARSAAAVAPLVHALGAHGVPEHQALVYLDALAQLAHSGHVQGDRSLAVAVALRLRDTRPVRRAVAALLVALHHPDESPLWQVALSACEDDDERAELAADRGRAALLLAADRATSGRLHATLTS